VEEKVVHDGMQGGIKEHNTKEYKRSWKKESKSLIFSNYAVS